MAVKHAELQQKHRPLFHFVGIGGAGMGAIASILLDRGYRVSGSDVAMHDNIAKLTARGADVHIGHDAANICHADYVVYSTAVAQDNVELVAAREQNIPIMHRSQMLAKVMQEGQGVAIAGAHGKTTTTSMVAFALEQAGLDPTFLIGGIVSNLGVGAKAGKGDFVIAEADESDGSFLNYTPAVAVVTNIEADHLEHYDGDFANLKKAYLAFMNRVTPDGLLIACIDSETVRDLLPNVSCVVQTYAIDRNDADYTVSVLHTDEHGSQCQVLWHGELLGVLELHVPGRHNIANALATIAVALHAGIPFSVIALSLKEFRGAMRRLQVLHDENDITIIDDYAHHPTEIKVTLAAVRVSHRRIVAVFQPQRYTRTFHLFNEFAKAFELADDVIITDIYSPAGEQPIAGVSASLLTDAICAQSNARAKYRATKDDVLHYLQTSVMPGDVVITMGAGDIWKVGKELSQWLAIHDGENVATV